MTQGPLGHHEPRGKRSGSKLMCPNWVRSEVAKLLNSLDGRYDTVMVGAVALLGEDGFDYGCIEQSTHFDPQVFGPVMLEGYSLIAGAALAKTLGSVHAACSSDLHFTRDIEDNDERLQAMRNLYEQAIRQFLQSVLTYAGAEFQKTINDGGRPAPGRPTESMIAGSQLVGLLQRVADATITFQQPRDQDEALRREDGESEGGAPGRADDRKDRPGEERGGA